MSVLPHIHNCDSCASDQYFNQYLSLQNKVQITNEDYTYSNLFHTPNRIINIATKYCKTLFFSVKTQLDLFDFLFSILDYSQVPNKRVDSISGCNVLLLAITRATLISLINVESRLQILKKKPQKLAYLWYSQVPNKRVDSFSDCNVQLLQGQPLGIEIK